MGAMKLLSALLLGLLLFASNASADDGYDSQELGDFFDGPFDVLDNLSDLLVRDKRQVGGPAGDAMDRSLTRNPVGQPEFGKGFYGGSFQDPKNFQGRVGGSAGVKVWENNGQSVGVGAAGRVNTGLSSGRPFVNTPEVGVGVGYQRGQFSTSVGVGHGYQYPGQRRPSTSYGVNFGYRFRRAAPVEAVQVDPVHDDDEDDDGQEDQEGSLEMETRSKRELMQSVNNAMGKSLTNNPVGKLDHDVHGQGAAINSKNYHGAFDASVGAKVWERNGQSVGVGLSGQTITGKHHGERFNVGTEYGAGIGYQNGPHSIAIGAGRTQRFPLRNSNQYGISYGYRFKRSALDDNEKDPEEEDGDSMQDVEDQDTDLQEEAGREKRQVYSNPVGKATYRPNAYSFRPKSNKPTNIHHHHNSRSRIGNGKGTGNGRKFKRSFSDDPDLTVEIEHDVRAKRDISDVAGMAMGKSVDPKGFVDVQNRYFNDRKNFGGTAVAGIGTTIRDTGRYRIGAGIAGKAEVGVYNGRPYLGPPRGGVGLSYQRGPVTTTLGVDHGRNPFGRRETNYGLNFSINPGYRG